MSRVRFLLAVSIAITIGSPMAFADPAIDELMSILRSCVRAHAQEAENAGCLRQMTRRIFPTRM